MNIDIQIERLKDRLERQLSSISGTDSSYFVLINTYIESALCDMEEALQSCRIKQVRESSGLTEFRARHIGQYAMFLYFLARRLWEASEEELAEDISYLNSSLNSIFLNHRVDMPKHFYMDHPMGTIIGRAEIGDYFFCMQRCTIGAETKNGKLVFPKLGEHVEMMSGSSIIGNCHIGDYVILSAGCLVKNKDIPSDCIVFGQDRGLIVKQYTHEEMLAHMACF